MQSGPGGGFAGGGVCSDGDGAGAVPVQLPVHCSRVSKRLSLPWQPPYVNSWHCSDDGEKNLRQRKHKSRAHPLLTSRTTQQAYDACGAHSPFGQGGIAGSRVREQPTARPHKRDGRLLLLELEERVCMSSEDFTSQTAEATAHVILQAWQTADIATAPANRRQIKTRRTSSSCILEQGSTGRQSALSRTLLMLCSLCLNHRCCHRTKCDRCQAVCSVMQRRPHGGPATVLPTIHLQISYTQFRQPTT